MDRWGPLWNGYWRLPCPQSVAYESGEKLVIKARFQAPHVLSRFLSSLLTRREPVEEAVLEITTVWEALELL